jgi:hypothetical protein
MEGLAFRAQVSACRVQGVRYLDLATTLAVLNDSMRWSMEETTGAGVLVLRWRLEATAARALQLVLTSPSTSKEAVLISRVHLRLALRVLRTHL